MTMLSLALFLGLQDPAVAEADALIAKLRAPLRQRREATDALLKLRRASYAVRPHLEDRLSASNDPIVRVRLDFVVRALIVEPAWTVENPPPSGSAHAGDDRTTIVTITSHGRVRALDAATGKLALETEPCATFFARPVVVRDRVVLPLGYVNGPMLRFIDLEQKAPAVNHRASALRPALLARDGDRVAMTMSGRLVTIPLGDPEKKELDLELRDECALAAADGHLAWANRRGRITCVETETGKTLWTAEGPHVPRLSVADGVLVAVGSARVAAFSLDDGREVWARNASIGLSAVHRGVVLYAVGSETTCADAATGAVRWTDRSGRLAEAMQTGAFADDHAVVNAGDRLEFVSLRTGAVDGAYPCEIRIRGIAVSERFVLVWHGANKLTALRVAD